MLLMHTLFMIAKTYFSHVDILFAQLWAGLAKCNKGDPCNNCNNSCTNREIFALWKISRSDRCIPIPRYLYKSFILFEYT